MLVNILFRAAASKPQTRHSLSQLQPAQLSTPLLANSAVIKPERRHIMGRGDLRIVLAALAVTLVGMALVVHSAGGTAPSSFRLLSVHPMVVVDTKLSGEQIPRQAYQAHIVAYSGAADADMKPYADRLFSEQLRAMAEREGKTQVWITFYLDRTLIDGTGFTKTFRAIYVHDATGWRPADRLSAKNASAELKMP